jgi:hypothetical protein
MLLEMMEYWKGENIGRWKITHQKNPMIMSIIASYIIIWKMMMSKAEIYPQETTKMPPLRPSCHSTYPLPKTIKSPANA